VRTENVELKTYLLINSRTDVALAVEADGVHLRSEDISPREAKQIWERAEISTLRESRRACPEPAEGVWYPQFDSLLTPVIGVSCHSTEEVDQAVTNGSSFAVFAPVFEKKDSPNILLTGLAQLREACKASIPVLALGGVTLANAHSCVEAGAAGVAAIRLFQENDISEVVKKLRG
jgi:thiamine-phosphate pyrophosphorylase